MQYLWINPVSAGMCEEDSLKRFLERHGLTRVECRGDWGRIVRERYEASLRAGVTLADARCPEAVRLLEEIQKEPENESGIENLKVAPIEPILLHCARELSTRPDLADGEKIITTPCQSLAVLGNSLGLENTRFIAWNRLAGGEVRVRAIEDSPIPPGRAQKWIAEHDAAQTAEIIAPQFPDTSVPVLTQVVQRYKDIDAWNATPVMTRSSLERLETVMETAGVLNHADWVDFDRLVDNSYAHNAS